MTTPTPRHDDDIVAALADAFDHVAPNERPAAEEELLDAGLDSDIIAARFAALAAGADTRASRSATVSDAPRRRRFWAIAAGLVLAVGAALLATRLPPARIARPPLIPRAVEPPHRQAAPAAFDDPVKAPAVVAESGETPRRESSGAGDAAAENEARMARAKEELGNLLKGQPPFPAAVRAAINGGAVALRETSVDREAIRGLQSAAFVAASTANAGRYNVDPNTCRLRAPGSDAPVTERFGYPFPDVAADRPAAACEIMWNVEAAFASGGGHRGRGSVCINERCGELRFVSLAFVGGQDKPVDNRDALRAASLTQLVSAPVTGTSIFVRDPLDGTGERRFLYRPETRRVRRLEAGPIEVDPPLDLLAFAAGERNCFDASPESYEWTLIGEQEVLAPLSGEGIQLGSAPDQNGAVPDKTTTLTVMWRPVWVVSGTRRSAISGPNRFVLYVDRELYRPYWKIVYADRRVHATYACGAAWARNGDLVAPLTSSVTRFDPEGGAISRFAPFDEVLDPHVSGDDVGFSVWTVAPR